MISRNHGFRIEAAGRLRKPWFRPIIRPGTGGSFYMIRRGLGALTLVFATSAHAAWYEATSNNFIVYSEGSEQEARDFAARLERFRFVLKTVRPIPEGQVSARLRVFLLPNQDAVGRMAGSAGVAGYYI